MTLDHDTPRYCAAYSFLSINDESSTKLIENCKCKIDEDINLLTCPAYEMHCVQDYVTPTSNNPNDD